MEPSRILGAAAVLVTSISALRPSLRSDGNGPFESNDADVHWHKSVFQKACHDEENCGPYGDERCRDAFCSACSQPDCDTLERAQTCCLQDANCSAVFGGGSHWWTFSGPCAEVDHPNYYFIHHKKDESGWWGAPTPPPPTDAPSEQPTDAPTDLPVADEQFPASMLRCKKGEASKKTACMDQLKATNRAIRAAVVNHHNSLDPHCGGVSCPRGDFAGCLLRLVGHDVMDFDPASMSGGADACIDFHDPDNKGLQGCLLQAVQEVDSVNVSLELMWQDWCTEVSAADFFVIAAEALIQATLPSSHREKWGDLLAQQFRFGRETKDMCTPEALPNPAHSCDAVKDNFVDKLGLTWTQATALMGVHTLGRALPVNSGYDGFWVSREHAQVFSNKYYSNMLGVGWVREQTQQGKMQWKRGDGKLQGEMMLNTDLCLAFATGEAEPFTRAEDDSHGGCCLWMDGGNSLMENVTCDCQGNSLADGCSHSNCCGSSGGCPGNNPFEGGRSRLTAEGTGESLDAVVMFAQSMDDWLHSFLAAWNHVTTNGAGDLCEMGM